MNSLVILAQTTAPASTAPAQTEGPGLLTNPMVPIILGIMVLYIFMAKGKKSESRKREDMLKLLKKGDEIQTIGGIIGKVVEPREDRVLIKVDETANTKIWFSRSAIHRVLEQEKTEAK